MKRINLKLTDHGVGMEEKQVTNFENPKEVSNQKKDGGQNTRIYKFLENRDTVICTKRHLQEETRNQGDRKWEII
jgi:hypothetical protein